ncbi:MAG: DNA repair protein RecN [Clostridiales bacterium]|nr:DNA repair protein RecN [Clostridiales bacterium]
MLAHLHIKNLGIIEEIDIELENGMNVLTGETGAGKSLIINAVQLILGGKFSKELIRKGSAKASVEALFLIQDEFIKHELEKLNIEIENELVITREISDRSLVKVNGSLISVNELKEIGKLLIDIHGQYDSQSLLNAKDHIKLLDGIALSGNKLINEYKELYNERNEYISKLNKIGGTAENRERQLEFLRFQLDELENANVKPQEDEELEEKIGLLNNSKNIIYALQNSYEKLNQMLPMIQKITSELSSISKYNENYNRFIEVIQNSFYELDEVTRDIKNSTEAVEVNPEELNKLEERLDLIIKLKRKYGNTIEEVLKTFSKLSNEYDELINSEQIVKDLESKIKTTEDKMYGIALQISNIRKEKAKTIEKEVEGILAELEMPKTTFNIKIEFDENRNFKDNGLDKVEFLFASNFGEELKPLSKIASGGEMSRIMLAIKNVLSDADKIPTMIFDEIDTGISGKAGFAVAEKLHNLAKDKQVICVTHLAAIAAKGDNNLYVDKGIENNRTVTRITKLNEEEVLNEIARIISGGNITETAIMHAKELRKIK